METPQSPSFTTSPQTNEAARFANNYCWVCRFDGDEIVEVRAYLDSMMVAYTILRNEIAAGLIERTPIAT